VESRRLTASHHRNSSPSIVAFGVMKMAMWFPVELATAWSGNWKMAAKVECVRFHPH